MDAELVLFGLRVASAVLIVVFACVVGWLLVRELRAAAAEHQVQRRSFGHLVVMFEVDSKMVPTGKRFPLLPTTSLGRSPTNTIPVDDNFASSVHATITRRSDQWWLEDRRSRNGTTLNGIPVEKPAIVTHGDVVGIGKMRYMIELMEN
ncbi:MAG: FHA domain-containing protein [Chloroflexi bacterium]|nr:FHA domain-containing protein [Chloroflexota bacterium]